MLDKGEKEKDKNFYKITGWSAKAQVTGCFQCVCNLLLNLRPPLTSCFKKHILVHPKPDTKQTR